MVSFKNWFDGLILRNLKANGYGPFGYELNNKPYSMYYNKEAFAAFKDEMEHCYPQHYKRYIQGQGSELKETSTPPKMASVASSSRFAYLALRNGTQAIGGSGYVEFEHECRIKGIRGTAPQLDAYTTDNKGTPIYVEVKCHEIFDPHKVELKTAYWENIYGEKNAFGFPNNPQKPADKTFNIPLDQFGIFEEYSMMDIKQLLCHLMGIASQKELKQPASLVYLFFKPVVTGNNSTLLNGIFSRLTDEIDRVFNSPPIRSFCFVNGIDLRVLVEEAAIMERLTTNNVGYLRDYPHK